MCYAGGPYCSSYARKAWLKKRYEARRVKVFSEEGQKIKAELREAEMQYYMTPAGMKELKRLISIGHPTDGREDPKVVLEYAIQSRALLMKKHALKDKGDVKHVEPKVSGHSFGSTEFDTTLTPRIAWSMTDNVAQLENDYIETSANFADSLTDDETDAVRWFTSSGSGDYGDFLGGTLEATNYNGKYQSKEENEVEIVKNIAVLDAALAKAENVERIVYRGVPDHFFPEDFYKYGDDYDMKKGEFLDTLTPGKELEFENYQSTSLDPTIAKRFASHDVVFEMKTSKGVPVGVVSAWYASEREMLLPRNTKFRVVKVLKDVPYDSATPSNRDGKWNVKEMIVIQLEEVN